MKFQLYSDVHAEFGHDKYPIWDKESSVLLLAGDIHLCRKLSAYQAWLEKVVAQGWNQVYLIMGNHEAYGALYHQALKDMHVLAEETGIEFLDNSLVCLGEDLWLFGGTMWTDLSNPLTANLVQTSLNDYRKIKWFNGAHYFKLNTQITTTMFFEFKEKLKEALDFVRDEGDRLIVMSHTAPHVNSSLSCYKLDSLTPAYFTDMSEFFSSSLPVWVHGHMHNSSDYTIEGTRILANPFGYYGSGYDERNLDFNQEGIGFKV